MNGTEAKQLFIKHAGAQLEQWGFKEKKSRNTDALFIRKKINGFERIGISNYTYYPAVVFGIGCSKRLNLVEKILFDINENISLNLKINSDESTINYLGKNQNLRKLRLLEVQHKDNELGVIDSSKILLDYIEAEVLPAFNLFDDIREIDKQINGEGENFWDFDDPALKPFTLAGLFYIRRHIIARLSKTDIEFEKYVERWINLINKERLENNKPPMKKDDYTNKHIMIVNYLKNNVSHI